MEKNLLTIYGIMVLFCIAIIIGQSVHISIGETEREELLEAVENTELARYKVLIDKVYLEQELYEYKIKHSNCNLSKNDSIHKN